MSGFRPFNAKLAPNDRKRPMLDATFNWLENAYTCSFGLLIGLYGGVQHSSMVEISSEGRKTKSKKIAKIKAQDAEVKNQNVDPASRTEVNVDADLACATLWFRLFPLQQIEDFGFENCLIKSEEDLFSRFVSYSGHSPSTIAQTYLTGSADSEKYAWIDCRIVFNSLAQKIGVKPQDLMVDVETMMLHKLLPFGNKECRGLGFCSSVFGVGAKSDKSMKARWYTQMVEQLENNEPATWEQYQDIIRNATGCRTHQEIDKISKGKPNVLSTDLRKELSGPIDADFLKQRKKKYAAEAKTFGHEFNLPNKIKLKEWFASLLGPYEQKIWGAAVKTAMVPLKASVSANLNFAEEKFKLSRDIAEIKAKFPDCLKAQSYLNNFRKGEENEFVIEPRHLKGLNDLYKLWQRQDMDSAIEECQQIYDHDQFSRGMIVDLARYLYAERNNISAEEFFAAAALNRLEENYARLKVNPVVRKRAKFEFGSESTIYGTLTLPNTKIPGQDRFFGETGMIWVTMELLDNGRWVKHHLPFHSSRYYREQYAYREGLPMRKEPRSPIFGFAPRGQIDLSKVDRNRSKASKAQLRTNAHMTHNCVIDPDTQFGVSRKDGEYHITISSRVESQNAIKTLDVGHRLMGIDQNQTAPNTYSVWEVVLDGEPNSFRHGGRSLKLVEDGYIQSITLGKDGEEIDQLSYDGSKPDWFLAWAKERIEFVSNLDKNQADRIKRSLDWSAQYRWVGEYAKLLMKIMKHSAKEGADIVALYRKEIESTILGSNRRGSLGHNALQMVRNLKSLLSSYFSLNGKLEIPERQSFDLAFFDLLVDLDKKIVCKRKSKVDRILSSIMQIANRLQVNVIAVEGDLSTTSKNSKSSANQRSMDWCSRKVVERLTQTCEYVGIKCCQIDQRDTSHLDPFVYEGNKEDSFDGKECRYNLIQPSEIREYHLKNFRKWWRIHRKEITPNSTNDYLYVNAFLAFAKEHGLDIDVLAQIKPENFWEFTKMVEGKSDLLLPFRGGRYYLSTYPVTSASRAVHVYGRDRYLNDSDVMAAMNIVLRGNKFMSESAKKKRSS